MLLFMNKTNVIVISKMVGSLVVECNKDYKPNEMNENLWEINKGINL